MELWDIYDEEGRPTGRTHPRGAAQLPGEYHLACTVILFNKKGELLCSHRSPEKKLCPNMWESPGGGVQAGEDSLTAAIREIGEELGLALRPEQLTLLYRDRRTDFFMDTYVGQADIPLSSLRFQPGETDGARWLPLDEWERLARAGEILTPAKGEFFSILREFVTGTTEPILCWSAPYGDAGLKEKIMALQAIAWPMYAESPWPEKEHLISFCQMDGAQLAAHVSVQGLEFTHKGRRYSACGIAEVVTHPDYRGRGLALRLLRRANAYTRQRQADVCIFTCDPNLVPLYKKAGWQACPDLCLTGGTEEKPFPSSGLGLTVMAALLSPKAISHAADFVDTEIIIPLGENQLW